MFLVTLLLILQCSVHGINSSLALTTNQISDSGSSPSSDRLLVNNPNVLKWALAGMGFFDFHRCTEAGLGSETDCFRLGPVTSNGLSVYVGYDRKRRPALTTTWSRGNSIGDGWRNESENQVYSYVLGKVGLSPSVTTVHREKVFVVLPDSNNVGGSGEHDLVLALDPYPNANFGHLIGLFYVDLNVEAAGCQEKHQIYIPDRTCLSVAKKPRCPNLMERHANIYHHTRKCHIDFLPTVHLVSASPSQQSSLPNLLECYALSGFAPCPKLRPVEETQRILCDATQTNTKGCDTSYSGVGTRCKLFQSCDRGVLIGGGWNRLHSSLKAQDNILKMEAMLLKNGFLSENIQLFHGNGGTPPQYKGHGSRPKFLSSAMKTGLRGHLRTICESRHCADSLFIYLNNPTTLDGDMLLWDMDQNGIADDNEIYSTKELLADISNCGAKRVIIVADQSNTDILMTLLKQSGSHASTILFTSGSTNQVTTNGELTRIWTNHSHPMACLKHIQQAASIKMTDSSPVVYDSTEGVLLSLSIAGAPCDASQPYSRELRSMYQGCQTVPTSVWFSSTYSDLAETEDEDDSLPPSQSTSTHEGNVSFKRRHAMH